MIAGQFLKIVKGDQMNLSCLRVLDLIPTNWPKCHHDGLKEAAEFAKNGGRFESRRQPICALTQIFAYEFFSAIRSVALGMIVSPIILLSMSNYKGAKESFVVSLEHTAKIIKRVVTIPFIIIAGLWNPARIYVPIAKKLDFFQENTEVEKQIAWYTGNLRGTEMYDPAGRFPFSHKLLATEMRLDDVLDEIANYTELVNWVSGRGEYGDLGIAPRIVGLAGIREGMKAGENKLSLKMIAKQDEGMTEILVIEKNGEYLFPEIGRLNTESTRTYDCELSIPALDVPIENTYADARENTDHSWYVFDRIQKVVMTVCSEADNQILTSNGAIWIPLEVAYKKMVPEHKELLPFFDLT